MPPKPHSHSLLEDRPYFLEDIEPLATALELNALEDWPVRLDRSLLRCRDPNNTPALAYNCAVELLVSRFALTRPPSMISTYAVRALRVRLDPRSTLRTGTARCAECIADEGADPVHGWILHGWIGCWGVKGGNCAVCVAMKRRQCNLPGEERGASESESDDEPLWKRRRIMRPRAKRTRRSYRIRGTSELSEAPSVPGAPSLPPSEVPSSDLSDAPELSDEDVNAGTTAVHEDLGDALARGDSRDTFARAAALLVAGAAEDTHPSPSPFARPKASPAIPREPAPDCDDRLFPKTTTEASQQPELEEGTSVTMKGENDTLKSAYPTPSPSTAPGLSHFPPTPPIPTPVPAPRDPTPTRSALKAMVRSLLRKFDRIHGRLDDVLRLDDTAMTDRFLADADDFRRAAQEVACNPDVSAIHADTLLVQWDRVEHYLPDVIRLKDERMNDRLRADAQAVKHVVEEIASAV